MLRELTIVRGQSLPAEQTERRQANQFSVSPPGLGSYILMSLLRALSTYILAILP
jgi:hypothetical protein